MDEQGRYNAAEQRAYQPPPCPDCGSANVHVNWVDATDLTDPPGANLKIPGTMQCRDCRNLQD